MESSIYFSKNGSAPEETSEDGEEIKDEAESQIILDDVDMENSWRSILLDFYICLDPLLQLPLECFHCLDTSDAWGDRVPRNRRPNHE